MALPTQPAASWALLIDDNGNVLETIPVSGTVTVTGTLTNAELRAADVKVSLDGEAVVLGAGTAAIGKLAPNSGVDIGDVDVASVPAPLSTTGGGVEAAALRVTIATDSTGVVSVDDNGAALTVDSTQLPAALAANGGMKVEGVVGGVAQPVTIAAGGVAPPGTFYHGQKTVATAGTEEAIAASQALVAGIVYVKAKPTNTGYVYVGKDPVTSSTGYPLLAGEEIVILTDNLADVFVDVSVNGEGVAYIGS